MPAHVLGALPPAVLTRYISCTFPAVSAALVASGGVSTASLSHGTAAAPSGPLGASAGAVVLATRLAK